jgi:hypothetical protein
MIDVLIFTKDRAAQLDLTLQGLKIYFKEWQQQKYTILMKTSNRAFQEAYQLVRKLHPEPQFEWRLESESFNHDVRHVFNKGKNPYQSFLVDDDVFINHFSLDSYEFNEFKRNDQIACLSHRISPYVNYCYTARISTPPPKEFVGKNIWNWKKPELAGDWNYPQSIASFHIFRKEDLSNAINTVPFTAPNSFEGNCLAPNSPHHRPLMICYDNCKIICGTNNRVQNENGNYHENTHDPMKLNNEFFAGRGEKRLNPKANDGIVVPMCHGPVKLEFQ